MSDKLSDTLLAACARLVADEGMDYGSAKRKAFRAMERQAGRAAPLPSDEDIEDAVREHIALFMVDTQAGELRALRAFALPLMNQLAEFRPYLSGAVWRGTATRQSPVLLDLYCDDAKSAEIALINLGLDHDTGSRTDARGRTHEVLSLSRRCADLADWVTVHLLVHDHDDLRGALKPDSRGRPWRGDTAAVLRLLAADGLTAAASQGPAAP